ncbi:MAG: tyrosine-type recombinase/integrase [Pseudomonadales bacterium]
MVKKYLDARRDELLLHVTEDRLFLADYGELFHENALGARIKKYLQQAGLEVIGNCHLLRHAMATHMLEHGVDVRFIQAMLGHEDLNTTEIYTQVSIEKLCEVHAATHPARTERTPEHLH